MDRAEAAVGRCDRLAHRRPDVGAAVREDLVIVQPECRRVRMDAEVLVLRAGHRRAHVTPVVGKPEQQCGIERSSARIVRERSTKRRPLVLSRNGATAHVARRLVDGAHSDMVDELDKVRALDATRVEELREHR